VSFETEIPVASKRAFLTGQHCADSTYFIALYETTAPRDKYSSNGESKGQGYTLGGQILDGYSEGVDGDYAWVNWSRSPIWERSSISAKEALIYNQSCGGKAVAVLVFDQQYKSINGTFELSFPVNGLTSLIVL